MRRRSLPIPVCRPGRPQAACPATFRPARRKTRPHGPARNLRPKTDLGPAGQRKDAFADTDIRRLGNDIDRPDPLEMPAAAHQRGGSPYPNPFFIIEQRSADRRPARRRTGRFPTPFRYCLRSSARIGPTPAQILKTCASLTPRTSRPRAERTGKPCGRSARLSGTQRPASRVRYRPAGAVAALSAANMCLP